MKKIFILLLTCFTCITLVIGQNNVPDASVPKPVPTESIFAFPTPIGSLKMNVATETVFKVPVKTESQISAAASNLSQSIQKTTYEDGFGRIQQSQIRRLNSIGKDLVQAYYYGPDDNTEISPLPLPITLETQGFYRDVNNGLRNAYNNLGYADENYLYEKVVNEKSPLKRSLETYAVGNSWVGSNKPVKTNSEYIENTNIPRFSISNSINSLPINIGFYTKLLQVTNTDEDFASGKSPMKKSFYDAQGQLICEKMESPDESTLTCFVYDDYGQLRYTITPKAMEAMVQNNNALSPNIINNLCFRNEYDDLGRLIFSKKPEIGAVNFVYDKFDRPILTQDAIQKQTNKWVFIKYDEMGRVIQSGIFDGVFTSPPGGTSVLNDDGTSSFYPSGSSVPYSRANLQVIVNSVNISNLFLNYLVHIKVVEYAQYLNFPDAEVMQVNIYDQYDQIPFMGFSSNLTTRTNGYLNEKSNKIKGLLTGTISKTSNNANLPVRTAYFYNNRQELILKATRGNNNSLRFLASGFDFSGRLIKTISRHSKIEISKKFSYDIYDRLTMIEHRVNSFNNYRPIARYFYDDLGRMRIRKLGGMGYNVNYHYNIRNWIVGINRNFALTRNNNDYFGMEVSYDNSFTETYLNGRVAGVKWRNKGTINEQRSYGYLYDGLGRLQLGDYHQITEGVSTTWSKSVKDFTTSNLSYDKNGNILTMKNMGVNGAKQIIVLDDLQYHYAPNSNRLLGVSESSNSQSSDPNLHNGLPDFRNVGATGATDYNYDANGNKSSDLNKGISNIDNKWFGLNKPIIIEFANNDKIEYVYDAMGSLISKKITQVLNNKVTTYDYVDEVIYKNGHLDGFSHEEGRIRVNSADDTYTYDYYIKDYLQNIRSVISESQVNSWGGDTHIDDIAWSPNPEQAGPDNPDGGLISEPTNAPDGISNSPVLYLATSEVQNDTLEELFFDNL
ncbi:MAG: DUF6443 domain-containing protein, partial [Bacteroidia bacterium]|nr:DUF6443 domain-containing protein [Bacteroidia bacterium]